LLVVFLTLPRLAIAFSSCPVQAYGDLNIYCACADAYLCTKVDLKPPAGYLRPDQKAEKLIRKRYASLGVPVPSPEKLAIEVKNAVHDPVLMQSLTVDAAGLSRAESAKLNADRKADNVAAQKRQRRLCLANMEVEKALEKKKLPASATKARRSSSTESEVLEVSDDSDLEEEEVAGAGAGAGADEDAVAPWTDYDEGRFRYSLEAVFCCELEHVINNTISNELIKSVRRFWPTEQAFENGTSRSHSGLSMIREFMVKAIPSEEHQLELLGAERPFGGFRDKEGEIFEEYLKRHTDFIKRQQALARAIHKLKAAVYPERMTEKANKKVEKDGEVIRSVPTKVPTKSQAALIKPMDATLRALVSSQPYTDSDSDKDSDFVLSDADSSEDSVDSDFDEDDETSEDVMPVHQAARTGIGMKRGAANELVPQNSAKKPRSVRMQMQTRGSDSDTELESFGDNTEGALALFDLASAAPAVARSVPAPAAARSVPAPARTAPAPALLTRTWMTLTAPETRSVPAPARVAFSPAPARTVPAPAPAPARTVPAPASAVTARAASSAAPAYAPARAAPAPAPSPSTPPSSRAAAAPASSTHAQAPVSAPAPFATSDFAQILNATAVNDLVTLKRLPSMMEAMAVERAVQQCAAHERMGWFKELMDLALQQSSLKSTAALAVRALLVFAALRGGADVEMMHCALAQRDSAFREARETAIMSSLQNALQQSMASSEENAARAECFRRNLESATAQASAREATIHAALKGLIPRESARE
jgi:hypothetical protein